VRGDALKRHHVADLLAKRGIALSRSVLQRDRSLFSHQVRDDIGHRVHGQRREVRHTAGEGDNLWSTCHREEGPDLGYRQASGPRRVLLDVGIKP
jgi:hypothetical protein